MFWWGLISGLFIGASIGIVVAAVVLTNWKDQNPLI